MRTRVLAILLSQTLACAAQPPPEAQPAPARPVPRAGEPARGAGALSRTFTGQQRPSLSVANQFHRVQHVFIDWVHQAALAPGHAQSFDFTPGTHTITCADSLDPDDNPASVTESFQTGFRYAYVISGS
ncbi:MAG TPA: hypothetical protein VGI10_13660 [Polyangiaceae bacterium]|jgi:hypothetical protein